MSLTKPNFTLNVTGINPREAARENLEAGIASVITALHGNDAALAADVASETAARIALDARVGADLQREATTRAADLARLSREIDSERTARRNVNAVIRSEYAAQVAGEAAARSAADDAEAALRAAGDAAILQTVEALIAGVDVPQPWSPSGGSFPAGAALGDSFRASDAGTIDGQAFAAGDLIYALTANASTTVFAGDWRLVAFSDLLLAFDLRPFDTLAAMQVSSTLVVGQTAKTPAGDFRIVAPGTYTANGHTVIDLAGIAGQAVALDPVFDSYAALSADTRPAAFLRSIHGTSGQIRFRGFDGWSWSMALAQDVTPHVTTAGGVGLTVIPLMGTKVSPLQFGAPWDGVGDDWPAITAAIDERAAAGGGDVILPIGLGRISDDIKMRSNVHLVGPGLAQFFSTSATTIRALPSTIDDQGAMVPPYYKGVALLDFFADETTGLVNATARGFVVEGTWAIKGTFVPGAENLDHQYTGQGEMGLRMQRTGNCGTYEMTFRFTDGPVGFFSGAWQSYVDTCFFKDAGAGFLYDPGPAGRSSSQNYLRHNNFQKCRKYAFKTIDSYAGDIADFATVDAGDSHIVMDSNIIEFPFQTTDPNSPLTYDPDWEALMVLECDRGLMVSNFSIAGQAHQDDGAPLVLIGSGNAGSLASVAGLSFVTGKMQVVNGTAFGFKAPPGQTVARVDNIPIKNVVFDVAGTGDIVDMSGPVPRGVLALQDCDYVTQRTGRRFAPIQSTDIKVGANGARALGHVSIQNAPNVAFRQQGVTAATIAAGATRDFVVRMQGARPGAKSLVQLMPDALLNHYTTLQDDVSLPGLTVAISDLADDNTVTITYTNTGGAALTVPAHKAWIKCLSQPPGEDAFTKNIDIASAFTVAAGGEYAFNTTVVGVSDTWVARAVLIGDNQGVTVDAYVSAADTVRVIFRNTTAAAVNFLPGQDLRIYARRYF